MHLYQDSEAPQPSTATELLLLIFLGLPVSTYHTAQIYTDYSPVFTGKDVKVQKIYPSGIFLLYQMNLLGSLAFQSSNTPGASGTVVVLVLFIDIEIFINSC